MMRPFCVPMIINGDNLECFGGFERTREQRTSPFFPSIIDKFVPSSQSKSGSDSPDEIASPAILIRKPISPSWSWIGAYPHVIATEFIQQWHLRGTTLQNERNLLDNFTRRATSNDDWPLYNDDLVEDSDTTDFNSHHLYISMCFFAPVSWRHLLKLKVRQWGLPLYYNITILAVWPETW